jgi:hypothetical protein
MEDLQRNEIEKFKAILKQHAGEVKTVEELLEKVIVNQLNLVLIDCSSNAYYLHEPNANDCNQMK